MLELRPRPPVDRHSGGTPARGVRGHPTSAGYAAPPGPLSVFHVKHPKRAAPRRTAGYPFAPPKPAPTRAAPAIDRQTRSNPLFHVKHVARGVHQAQPRTAVLRQYASRQPDTLRCWRHTAVYWSCSSRGYRFASVRCTADRREGDGAPTYAEGLVSRETSVARTLRHCRSIRKTSLTRGMRLAVPPATSDRSAYQPVQALPRPRPRPPSHQFVGGHHDSRHNDESQQSRGAVNEPFSPRRYQHTWGHAISQCSPTDEIALHERPRVLTVTSSHRGIPPQRPPLRTNAQRTARDTGRSCESWPWHRGWRFHRLPNNGHMPPTRRTSRAGEALGPQRPKQVFHVKHRHVHADVAVPR